MIGSKTIKVLKKKLHVELEVVAEAAPRRVWGLAVEAVEVFLPTFKKDRRGGISSVGGPMIAPLVDEPSTSTNVFSHDQIE